MAMANHRIRPDSTHASRQERTEFQGDSSNGRDLEIVVGVSGDGYDRALFLRIKHAFVQEACFHEMVFDRKRAEAVKHPCLDDLGIDADLLKQ